MDYDRAIENKKKEREALKSKKKAYKELIKDLEAIQGKFSKVSDYFYDAGTYLTNYYKGDAAEHIKDKYMDEHQILSKRARNIKNNIIPAAEKKLEKIESEIKKVEGEIQEYKALKRAAELNAQASEYDPFNIN